MDRKYWMYRRFDTIILSGAMENTKVASIWNGTMEQRVDFYHYWTSFTMQKINKYYQQVFVSMPSYQGA